MGWNDSDRRWNLIARLGLAGIAISTLAFAPAFAEHIGAHLTGAIAGGVITGQWHVVFFNIALFLSFLVPLTFRRKADWKEYTIVVAFIVSLFVEMYGVPFLILLVAGGLGVGTNATVDTPVVVDFFGVELALSVPMVYGVVLMVIGTLLVVVGWYQLYRGVRAGQQLVTSGVYAVSRNPQYLGFMLVIVGWWVGWPTLLVMVFAPVLIFMYYRLCRAEEREVEDLPGYDAYRSRVPLVI